MQFLTCTGAPTRPPVPKVEATESTATFTWSHKLKKYEKCSIIVTTDAVAREAELIEIKEGSAKFKVLPNTTYSACLRVSILNSNIHSDSDPIMFTSKGMNNYDCLIFVEHSVSSCYIGYHCCCLFPQIITEL